MQKKPEILIVDDDKALLTQLKIGLSKSFNITTAHDSITTINLLSDHKYDLLLLDLHLPPSPETPDEGFKLLNEIKNSKSEMLTIIISGNEEKENAVKAMEKGAYDYFTKPFNFNELELIIKRALTRLQLDRENKQLKLQLLKESDYKNMIGKSQKMQDLYSLIKSASESDANILITGESGTGKELVAKAIHNASKRKNFPFIIINCAALSENLLEDELFGHEKGAFTGAHLKREGRFEAADRGTIFLDEISSITPKLQAALLRVIQEKEFERIGSSKTINVDVRLIAATNRPLEKLINESVIREDFYYRINVFNINLPPLRERKEDILLLINHFISLYSAKNRKKVKKISKEALSLLEAHDWPGNIRELENVIERAVILAPDEEIQLKNLPEALIKRENIPERSEIGIPKNENFKLDDYILKIQKDILSRYLEQNKWNKKITAEKLGITYRQIKYLCEKLNL